MVFTCLVWLNKPMHKRFEKLITLARRALKSQSFRRYLFVGFSTVAIDYILLALLRNVFSSSLVYAVSIAYWTSIAYNFLLNRHWSFGATEGLVPKQIFLYGMLLVFNYLITLLVVWGLESFGMSEYIAKLFALGLTITWTYVLYKKIVFTVK